MPPEQPTEDVLSIRDKARRHLMTWSKEQLTSFIAFTGSSDIEKWAEEYDKTNDGR